MVLEITCNDESVQKLEKYLNTAKYKVLFLKHICSLDNRIADELQSAEGLI